MNRNASLPLAAASCALLVAGLTPAVIQPAHALDTIQPENEMPGRDLGDLVYDGYTNHELKRFGMHSVLRSAPLSQLRCQGFPKDEVGDPDGDRPRVNPADPSTYRIYKRSFMEFSPVSELFTLPPGTDREISVEHSHTDEETNSASVSATLTNKWPAVEASLTATYGYEWKKSETHTSGEKDTAHNNTSDMLQSWALGTYFNYATIQQTPWQYRWLTRGTKFNVGDDSKRIANFIDIPQTGCYVTASFSTTRSPASKGLGLVQEVPVNPKTPCKYRVKNQSVVLYPAKAGKDEPDVASQQAVPIRQGTCVTLSSPAPSEQPLGPGDSLEHAKGTAHVSGQNAMLELFPWPRNSTTQRCTGPAEVTCGQSRYWISSNDLADVRVKPAPAITESWGAGDRFTIRDPHVPNYYAESRMRLVDIPAYKGTIHMDHQPGGADQWQLDQGSAPGKWRIQAVANGSAHGKCVSTSQGKVTASADAVQTVASVCSDDHRQMYEPQPVNMAGPMQFLVRSSDLPGKCLTADPHSLSTIPLLAHRDCENAHHLTFIKRGSRT